MTKYPSLLEQIWNQFKYLVYIIIFIICFISFLMYINSLETKQKEKTEKENIENQIKSDKIKMKMGMVMYRNFIFIYNGNERKADSAYYANEDKILRDVYNETKKLIPTK